MNPIPDPTAVRQVLHLVRRARAAAPSYGLRRLDAASLARLRTAAGARRTVDPETPEPYILQDEGVPLLHLPRCSQMEETFWSALLAGELWLPRAGPLVWEAFALTGVLHWEGVRTRGRPWLLQQLQLLQRRSADSLESSFEELRALLLEVYQRTLPPPPPELCPSLARTPALAGTPQGVSSLAVSDFLRLCYHRLKSERRIDSGANYSQPIPSPLTDDQLVLCPHPDLEVAWATLIAGAISLQPRTLPQRQLAEAADAVADWAWAGGCTDLAVLYWSLALQLDPSKPGHAYGVGRALRRKGAIPQAHSWLRYAATVARQCSDWGTCAKALNSLGTLHLRRHDLRRAETWYLRAMSVIDQHGLKEHRACILHDLLMLRLEQGQWTDAEKLGPLVREEYGADESFLTALEHDLAVVFLRKGEPDAALPILLRWQDKAVGENGMLFTGTLAKVAAKLSDRTLFERARSRFERLDSESSYAPENLTGALLRMASGAEIMGELEYATVTAERVVSIATARQEKFERAGAVALLQRLGPTRPSACDGQ